MLFRSFLSGHTHRKTLEQRDGVLYVNPGSPSIPKDGTASFAVYDNGRFTLRDLESGAAVAEATL